MRSPLLNPDNRLLSWSIGDIGLYGAVLAPATIAAADDARAQREEIEAAASGTPNQGHRVETTSADTARSMAEVGPLDSGQGAFSTSSLTPLPAIEAPLTSAAAIGPVLAPTLAQGDVAPGVPNPIGSGSVSSPLAQQPAPYVADADMGASGAQAAGALASPILSAPAALVGTSVNTPVVSGTLDAVQSGAIAAATAAQAALLSAVDNVATLGDSVAESTLGTTLGQAEAVGETLGSVLTGATDVLGATLATATDGLTGTGNLLSPVADLTDAVAEPDRVLTPVTSGIADTAAAATAPLSGVVSDDLAGSLETLSGAVAETVDPVAPVLSDTVSSVAAPIADGAGAATAAVTPAVADVVDSLTAASSGAAASNDLLGDIGGADPAAGVATLVDMVASADEFDLSHVVTAPAAEDAGSIADLLAVDIADAPLLGDTHTDDHAADDDGGLLGL